jgi:hypothetical protein
MLKRMGAFDLALLDKLIEPSIPLVYDRLDFFQRQTLVPVLPRNNSTYSDVTVCVLIFAFRKDLPFDQARVHLDCLGNAERPPTQLASRAQQSTA